MGVDHHLDLVGRTDFDMPCDTVACAELFRAQDKEVMVSMEPLRILDVHPFAGGEWKAYLVTKSPMVEDDQVIGTVFNGADITSAATIELGSLLGRIHAGIGPDGSAGQTSYVVNRNRGTIELTSRQAEVLFFLIRGKSSRDIAAIFDISIRTVEHHAEQLRGRFAANNKAELIDQAINQGYLNYIPETLFKKQLSLTLR
jgi:DNA-binding CsgD family transcriptional regulator